MNMSVGHRSSNLLSISLFKFSRVKTNFPPFLLASFSLQSSLLLSIGAVHVLPLPIYSFRMEGGGSATNFNDEASEIWAEFMVGVIKFEELVEVGRNFLIRFQQALEFLRRPSIYDSSDLVMSIIDANETKRAKAYLEAGCINAYDSSLSVSQLNTSLCDLWGWLSKANDIINELEHLMDKAGDALFMNSEDQSEVEFQGSEQETSASENFYPAGFASSMAVIYSMVKQDYTMQEKIVSSLSFKSSSAELESYCLMWMLRPFVNDDVVHQALRV